LMCYTDFKQEKVYLERMNKYILDTFKYRELAESFSEK